MRLLKSGLLGMMIGSLIFLVIGVFFTDDSVRSMILGVLVMSLLFGLLSQVYNSSLALLSSVLIHLFGSYLVFIGVAYFFNWFPFNPWIVLSSTIIFVVIFMIIWTIYYFVEKKRIAKMNEQLK